jgi:iron complex transport system substrate-binding protein
MRIISLTCSNTEIVCALGCEEMLVGVDDHSDYPEEVVSRLPRVGPDLQIDIAKVAALKPDLVLASLTVPGHEKVLEGLEKAGLPFIAPEPIRMEDIYRDILDIATRLGVEERGRELAAEMREAFASESLATSEEERGDAPSILVQWWPKPVIAPGQQSWIHEMILAAGGRHPLEAEAVKSRPMTDEEVLEKQPDAIVISWCGVPFHRYRPDVIRRKELWRELPAVRHNRIFCIAEAFMGRPSPRLLEGLRQLKEVVAACQRTQSSGAW